jgi:hypothetical protein
MDDIIIKVIMTHTTRPQANTGKVLTTHTTVGVLYPGYRGSPITS